MSEPKKGTPLAAAHLRPETRGQSAVVQEAVKGMTEEELAEAWAKQGQIVALPDDQNNEEHMALQQMLWQMEHLAMLREPFADDQIEKLPKPMWKGAWDGIKGSNCPVCNGYHVTSNAIHLDYVGHANATNRLLDADLAWNWEPMAYTEHGTPLFTDGGLWIKLTVCGVTRLGFGDGGSVKEVIGDAIRNAAMRFGVALDLWSKINLHEGINQGDGQTQRRTEPTGSGVSRERGAGVGANGRQSTGGREEDGVASDAPRAANQDALDALASVCDEHGYDRRSMRELYAKWAKRIGKGNLELTEAPASSIGEFSLDLVVRANAEPTDGREAEGADAVTAAVDPPVEDSANGAGVDGSDSGVEDATESAPAAIESESSDAFADAPPPASDDPAEMF